MFEEMNEGVGNAYQRMNLFYISLLFGGDASEAKGECD